MMSDETQSPKQPDFDEHLQEATHKRPERQQATAEDWELEEDALSLSTKAQDGNEISPRKRQQSSMTSGEADDRLLWIALLLGGMALVITLIMAALLYRQSSRIDNLQETVALLEEQMESANPADMGAELHVEIAQLNSRLNELDHRLTQLRQTAADEGQAGAIAELKTEVERLNETLSGIQPRLAKLEQVTARVAHPSSSTSKARATNVKGWYIILASLGNHKAAEKLQRQYRQQGIRAEIHAVTVKGKRWYRLRVGPFATQRAAAQQAARLKQKLQLTSVWLSR